MSEYSTAGPWACGLVAVAHVDVQRTACEFSVGLGGHRGCYGVSSMYPKAWYVRPGHIVVQ